MRRNEKNLSLEALPNCIGYLDGTEIKLAEAPVEDPESYFSRKHIYSLKVQAIFDHNKKIRHMVLGYPGSVHDSRIYSNCELYSKPAQYFSGLQWLAADSAYKLTSTVITPFRESSNELTLLQRKRFNKEFSAYRIRIEHCFGLLKERFNSLKDLKLQIKDDASIKRSCRWILVCAILHNIVIEQNNGDEFDFIFEEANIAETENTETSIITSEGVHKRRALSQMLFS